MKQLLTVESSLSKKFTDEAGLDGGCLIIPTSPLLHQFPQHTQVSVPTWLIRSPGGVVERLSRRLPHPHAGKVFPARSVKSFARVLRAWRKHAHGTTTYRQRERDWERLAELQSVKEGRNYACENFTWYWSECNFCPVLAHSQVTFLRMLRFIDTSRVFYTLRPLSIILVSSTLEPCLRISMDVIKLHMWLNT